MREKIPLFIFKVEINFDDYELRHDKTLFKFMSYVEMAYSDSRTCKGASFPLKTTRKNHKQTKYFYQISVHIYPVTVTPAIDK